MFLLGNIILIHLFIISDEKVVAVVRKTSSLKHVPDRSICGPLAEENRIFGGDVASADEFPWLVRLKYALKNGSKVYACAGSLITNRYIVTAAHCIVNLTLMEVRLGDIGKSNGNSNDKVFETHTVDVEVDKAIAFPGYSRRCMFKNDIALLRLQRVINFTDFIKPVCLPTTDFTANQDYDPENIYWTAGWGQTEFERKSPVKRKVALEAVPMPKCRVAEPVLSNESAPYTICAGGQKGKDTCTGDSGGSLVKQIHENNSTNWFLFGITSYGYKDCGTEGRPGLYTRVTKYMEWILHNIS